MIFTSDGAPLLVLTSGARCSPTDCAELVRVTGGTLLEVGAQPVG